MLGMKGINQPTSFVNISDECFSWSCAFYLLWAQLYSVFYWFIRMKPTRIRVDIWPNKEVHKNFILFQMHMFLFLCDAPSLSSISNGNFFLHQFTLLMPFSCLGWLESACILDFSVTHRKKANSLKLSGKGFKTQCASLLGAREPVAETKSEEKILSLEASQHNHSFSCNSSNVPTTAINNVMKQITCYLSQLWSMESNWSNLGEKNYVSEWIHFRK